MMSFDLNSRMRAIATNAIREARIAKQIDTGPWLDDHANRLDVIFQTLRDIQSDYDSQVEHYPLVNAIQPETDKKLSAVSKILDGMDDDFSDIGPSFKIPKAAE